MAVVAFFQSPSFTQDAYEKSVRVLTDGKKSAVDSPADWPVEGLLAHVAGEGANGFYVLDVWESEEALRLFEEHLAPAMAELGIEGTPDIHQAHTFVSA